MYARGSIGKEKKKQDGIYSISFTNSSWTKKGGDKKARKKVNVSKLRCNIGSSHVTHKKGIDAKVIKIGVMHKILALKQGKSK